MPIDTIARRDAAQAAATIDWGRPGPEPQVEEMVRDPIVQLVMRRDRLTIAQVMATVTSARARLRAALSGALPRPPS